MKQISRQKASILIDTGDAFIVEYQSMLNSKPGEMVELADGTGLENRHRCKSVKGSNPFLSAISGEIPKRLKGAVC